MTLQNVMHSAPAACLLGPSFPLPILLSNSSKMTKKSTALERQQKGEDISMGKGISGSNVSAPDSKQPASYFSSFRIGKDCPDPLPEDPKKDIEWTRCKTCVSYAQINVEKHLGEERSIIAPRLLKNFHRQHGDDGCLEDPQKVANELEHHITLLLEHKPEEGLKKELSNLLKEIQQDSPNLWYPSPPSKNETIPP